MVRHLLLTHPRLLVLGLILGIAPAWAQGPNVYRGEIEIYLQSGAVQPAEQIALTEEAVWFGNTNDPVGIIANKVDYISVITPEGSEHILVQTDIERRFSNVFSVPQRVWLRRDWSSSRMEIFAFEELRYSSPLESPGGFYSGGGHRRYVKYYYRKDGGVIRPVGVQEVVADVADHSEAVRIATGAMHRKRMSTSLKGGGIAVLLGSFLVYPELGEFNQRRQVGIAGAGFGAWVIGGVVDKGTDKRLLEAIKRYK